MQHFSPCSSSLVLTMSLNFSDIEAVYTTLGNQIRFFDDYLAESAVTKAAMVRK